MIRKPESFSDIECRKSSDHVDFAVSKVDQLQDSVNHRVAQSDESVDASETDAVDEMLNKLLAMTLVQYESPDLSAIHIK